MCIVYILYTVYLFIYILYIQMVFVPKTRQIKKRQKKKFNYLFPCVKNGSKFDLIQKIKK